MFELPKNTSKEELRNLLKKINKDWKKELQNKGLEENKDFAIEQLKNYKVHVEDYKTSKEFKKERNLSDNQTASDGFTPEELKRELNLEELQTKFLKETKPENRKEAKRANEFIRKKKEHWFD